MKPSARGGFQNDRMQFYLRSYCASHLSHRLQSEITNLCHRRWLNCRNFVFLLENQFFFSNLFYLDSIAFQSGWKRIKRISLFDEIASRVTSPPFQCTHATTRYNSNWRKLLFNSPLNTRTVIFLSGPDSMCSRYDQIQHTELFHYGIL